ncbi:cysteine desulfurase family protein [Paenibacillus sp. LHD-117]|uniref:cysteine desulfurase family protein n=1 Tax=Paenibacillus sp. LHD-117 TaxID=3071412 RepID=UPI0027DF9BDF|nr:cysteine desulfurase family protein [Paenibacillus sp. LHD-117]MDQ6418997.1 cysteine desulfurase family protein [Paenibacillus sp. LHD-117]
MKDVVYFDHCASTPPYEDVARTVMEVMMKHYANPSSLHGMGVEASKLLDRSRALLAGKLQTSKGGWLFTSGGTESNNLAIKGSVRYYRSRGNHIVTTGIEHASVLEATKQLEAEGFRVTYLPVSPSGHVRVEDVRAALTKETVLVSVMHVNNEIGTVQPIEEIGRLLRDYPKTLFHVDAVQSLGKLPIDIEGWGIDLLSGSAHKLRGTRGVGFLYVREGIGLQPLASGGTHEKGMRAGTENVPSIVASAKAVRLAVEGIPSRAAKTSTLRDKLRAYVETVPELSLNGRAPLAPHIVNFSYPGMKPEVIVHMLEQRGIIASTRSACSSKDNKPSRVLLEIGASPLAAASGIRISFGDEHTEEHVDRLIQALDDVIKQLKPLERST